MPIINGKRVKATYTSLKLDELSSVDRPAQAGARAVIMKRDPTKGEMEMTELEKLQAANDDLTAKLAKAQADCDAKDEELEDMKKALAKATDESVTVGGEEFRKSEVGDVSFRAMKAMQTERDTARFEKQAGEGFPNLVGTTAEKALVLKARDAMDEPTRKALDAIMSSAEKMVKAGFERIGTSYPGIQPTAKVARDSFDGKVSEIQKRDNISRTAAMQKARSEFPAEFAEAYPNEAAN